MSAKSILVYISIWVFWIATLLWYSPVRAETRIAIIDTGLNAIDAKICPGSEKSYVALEGMKDYTGHGTEVANVLISALPTALQYCIIPIKIFDKDSVTGMITISNAIRYAVAQKADIINLSFSGTGNSLLEKTAVKFALNSNIIVVIAAGNEGINLDKDCNRFPACHDARAIVVGYHDKLSNVGKVVDIVTNGDAVRMSYDENGKSVLRSGSSFAAPRIASLVAVNLNTFKSKLIEVNKGR